MPMVDVYATAKTTCVVGGMLADADSIDDLETRVELPCRVRLTAERW
jgi:hypothetical protein